MIHLHLPPDAPAVPIQADRLDDLEAALGNPLLVQAECPVKHRFTPGLYIREIFIPAGTLLVTGTHKQTHPFVISIGLVRVFSEKEGSVEYAAPYTGITEAGTRRALLALSDVIWTTFHPTSKTAVEEVLADLLEDHANPDMPPDFVPGYFRDLSAKLPE